MEVKLIMEEQTQIDSTQDNSESAEEQKQSLRDQISNALIGDDNTDEKVEETKEEEQPAEESEEQAEDSDEQEEVQQEEAKELEALKAPQHWPKDFSEQFDSWQPEVQHLFKERYDAMESDYTKKTQGLAKYKKRNEALDEIYGPFKDDFQRAGMDEVAATRQLLAAHKYLREDPKQALKWLAQSYGVDLTAVNDDTATEDEYADPQIKSLQQQVAQLSGFIQNQQTQQQNMQQQSTQSLIDQFAAEKDESGNVKYPHFEAVRNRMGALINSNDAKDLPTAYDMAVYADPKLRQEMLDNYATKKTQQTVKTDAVKKAKKAQRSTVRGSATPAVEAVSSGMSVRETIDLTLKQLAKGA
mgnify:FL=1